MDKGTYALWWSIHNQPDELLSLVYGFKPSREAFFQFKHDLLGGVEFPLPEFALRKLAVHQMSFSGLGVRAGGPMTAIASRWSPRHIQRNVEEARRLLDGRQVTITNMDYKAVLSRVDSDTSVFVDPPYVVAGSVLYQHAFTQKDHVELGSLLAAARFPWVLTYDDCTLVRRMYGDDTIVEIPMTYSVNGISKKRELLITPKSNANIPAGIRFSEPFARRQTIVGPLNFSRLSLEEMEQSNHLPRAE